ncbi:hypothetical protein [Cupriavidus sp. D39]|uniref:hypothetical protein n=1 Tax=Cupriavidus sp. D39 TaxID=2997877 RepID=UPI002270A06B|nr:hypothetical protein [Cupriavidus sp. D39]MCY0853082.1 hypothetical protein [Cupriavidus sp. D39]
MAAGHPSGWITPQATGPGFVQSRRPAGVSMVPTAPLCAVAAAVAQLQTEHRNPLSAGVFCPLVHADNWH